MRKSASYLSLFAILALTFLIWTNRFAIFDAWRLRGYTPPAEVVALADETTMQPSARNLFYVYRPIIGDRATFSQYCEGNEKTIVLGCYLQNQGIYLFDVEDPRLDGVIEVTAAHELLHAAYDRLSSKERQRIDQLNQQVFEQSADERLKETIQNYRDKDPGVVPNELHSILPTEIENLPAELEQYYSQYFKDRKAIVKLANQYKQAFQEREDKIKSIDERLKVLRKQIDTINADIETQQVALEQKLASMQQQRRSGDTDGYNAQVPEYNRMVNQFNALITEQKAITTEHNRLVEERNSLATEENELIEAIDSRQPIETQ